MLIHVKTKAGMSEKALDILNDLKGVLFDQVDVKDDAFLEKKKELNGILQNALDHPNTLKNHEQVWQEIESQTK